MGESDQYGVGPVTLTNHTSMSTLHFSPTLPPFFQVSGFLGLPPVSQGCLCPSSGGRRGILIRRRQSSSSKSPQSFIAISQFIGEMTLIDAVTSGGSFQCTQIFDIPQISDFPNDQLCQTQIESLMKVFSLLSSDYIFFKANQNRKVE